MTASKGVISGVNSFGIFVELTGIYVSGLVHITALDYDYFHFDPTGHRLSGERTGKVYRLGDTLKVKVAAVNIDDRKIDFVLAEKIEGPGKGRGRPRDGDRPKKRRRPRGTDSGKGKPKDAGDAAKKAAPQGEAKGRRKKGRKKKG